MTPTLDDRLAFASPRTGPLEPLACRALRKAVHLLSLLVAHRLQDLRNGNDPIMKAQGKIEEQTALVAVYAEIVELLGQRCDKIPDKNRPHYTPNQRFRILRIKHLLGLSVEDAAHLFRVAPGTIARWQTEAAGHPDKTTIGKIVRPSPPLRRYADVVVHTVQSMALLGFEGYETIAQTLARAGWRIGKTTVARYLKKPNVTPSPSPDPKPSKLRVLLAKYVNHIWLMDFTPVTGLFGVRQFMIGAVLDVFSRFPLAVQVFAKEPSAEQAVTLLETAIRQHGRPRHFVSDQGTQFTADLFGDTLGVYRIRRRFGAVGKQGSIAIVERFFRTMKQALGVRLWRPLLQQDLEQRLASALTHYCAHRPHTSLHGATPAEIFFGFQPANRNAEHPPRGRPGEGPQDMPFTIAYVDRERRLPILEKAAA